MCPLFSRFYASIRLPDLSTQDPHLLNQYILLGFLCGMDDGQVSHHGITRQPLLLRVANYLVCNSGLGRVASCQVFCRNVQKLAGVDVEADLNEAQ